jgi:hypothetical protein
MDTDRGRLEQHNAPIQVKNANGVTGVQKPGLAAPTNPHTAATEKIVADLAYHLGLPIPPATLWDRGPSAGAPRYVAVSAWAYEKPHTWAEVDAALTPAQRAELIPWASAMLPFESWIDAQDRQNAGNVVVGTAANGAALAAWIDYAFSLDHVWKGNPVTSCHAPPIYPPVGAAMNDVMIEVADRIGRVENAVIEGIVNRIPSEYLPGPAAYNVIRNLRSRRGLVRALL